MSVTATSLPPAAAAALSRGVDPGQDTASGAEDITVAARKFEGLLARELLRAMRATVEDANLTGGSAFGRQTLTAMLDDRLADAVAGRFGLAERLAEQLGPALGTRTSRAPRLRTPLPTPAPRPARAPTGPLSTGLVPFAATRLPPADGPISSPFGRRVHPVTGRPSFHEGVDIAAPEGSEIRAARAGKVVHAGPMGSYGLTVEIDHGDGTRTRYAHASRVHVRRGDRVDAGEAVADVGATGRATGPHLHLELRRGGRAVDPSELLGAMAARPAPPPEENSP